MIGLDTETTGLDLYHGAKPYLVTIAKEDGTNTCWEWDVNPKTRQPVLGLRDLTEIQQEFQAADYVVLQNTKFDYQALEQIYKGMRWWDWSKIYDTLLAGHLLASNQSHDLTSMALMYLKVNIQPLESTLEKATKEAISVCKRDYPEYRLARKDLPEMPSARGKTWKYDAWLPRHFANLLDKPENHSWWTVLSDYANGDSATTLTLFRRQQGLLEERGLWHIYLERLKVLPIVCAMEKYGVTLSGRRLEQIRKEYTTEAEKAGRVCLNVAKSYGYDLVLPKSGSNGSLKRFIFDVLKLNAVAWSDKTGESSMDKATLEHWEATLPARSKQLLFVKNLKAKRKRDTAVNYLDSYKRFWLPRKRKWFDGKFHVEPGWFLLHPSLNPTGTDTLRWSSQNPNEQNISKQEGFNLRYCFGPAPGREWWSMDYQNLELRIPAYEAGEKDVVYVFEHPDDSPYYGSYHLLLADLLHPDKFKRHSGKEFKHHYESTWYQWLKNGNFAVIYGAQEGTADRTYHVPGAYAKIQRRFPRIAALSRRQIEIADRLGYVETIPDETVDPKRGYPLLCSRSKWGRVIPTVPLNYHVQGTAMWVTMKAMIRCYQYLDRYNLGRNSDDQAYMVLQVHDELVFDFPKRFVEAAEKYGNLLAIRELQKLMEKSGGDIGIPTPVAIEYRAETWSEGESC